MTRSLVTTASSVAQHKENVSQSAPLAAKASTAKKESVRKILAMVSNVKMAKVVVKEIAKKTSVQTKMLVLVNSKELVPKEPVKTVVVWE